MGSVDMELALGDAANGNDIRLRDSGNGSLKTGAADLEQHYSVFQHIIRIITIIIIIDVFFVIIIDPESG